jgi:hypothetical protein
MNTRGEMHTTLLLENLKEIDYGEDLDVDRRIR